MVDEIINAFYDSEHHCGYDYVYTIDNAPKNDDEFKLHNHNDRYEIVLFLAGNAEFHIEGNIYRSHPHDIYIARPLEMHHNYFLSSEKYARVVIHIPLNFFTDNHCTELERVFLDRAPGVDCQIPARIVDREMYHLLMKMNTYIKDGAYDKYYLCRIFKRITGYTVNHYINYKRLLLARELHSRGQTLLEASTNAGFNSYAHFYRMFRREFGINPRNDMERDHSNYE